MSIRIGIDVGGTNTDAVSMRQTEIVDWVKTPTTPDITSGIMTALTRLLEKGGVRGAEIDSVMIGTTHFTNAVVERRGLIQTAVIRLALPATEGLPPMIDWPSDLREAIGHHVYMLRGGYEFDGREISSIDEDEVKAVVEDLKKKEITSVAITSVFSPINASHEERVAQLIGESIPDISITLSHEVGRIGLLERENAAILNACLLGLSRRIIQALRETLGRMSLGGELFLTQNDGTLMAWEHAEKYPILTIGSGPTNSMRGAAFLSGIKDAIAIDIGGTTTDVGALVNGFPRQASVAVNIAGVRTNFRMPDVFSIGLGGGSIISIDPLRIGPQSVGYELDRKALIFGGDTLTATDIAVASGLADLGNLALVRKLDRDLVQEVREGITAKIESAIDKIKTGRDPVPVILVGGGSILVGSRLAGTSRTIKPPHFAVANAVGAAIAQVSGEVDRIFSLDKMKREEILRLAKEQAIAKAIKAGVERGSIEVVEIDEIPLTYLTSNAIRVRIKVVGELKGRSDN